MSAYRAAIDQTTSAIEQRSRNFRNQIVTVVIISALSAAVALFTWSFRPLLGMMMLVAIVGSFLLADSKILEAWRSDLLVGWVRRDIDFAAFRKAIRANPALPKETIEGMLATLPSAGDLVSEQRLSNPTRRAVAAEATGIYRSRADALALKAAASGVVALVLIAAVWIRSWEPLIALASLGALSPLDAWMKRRRIARSACQIEACRAQPDFNEADYIRVRGSFQA